MKSDLNQMMHFKHPLSKKEVTVRAIVSKYADKYYA